MRRVGEWKDEREAEARSCTEDFVPLEFPECFVQGTSCAFMQREQETVLIWFTLGQALPSPSSTFTLPCVHQTSMSISHSEREWSSGKNWIGILVLAPGSRGALDKLLKFPGLCIWKKDGMGLLGRFKD